MKIYMLIITFIVAVANVYSQDISIEDTLYRKNINPVKVDHAEPLNIDLMRDLGARKGEAEFNIGYGINNHHEYIEHYGFVEYEWAVANRLGLEVEIPFSFIRNSNPQNINESLPHNKIEGVKLASQYTFYVNEKAKMSMAVGYVHEFELNNFYQIKKHQPFLTGMKMNPVYIAAKNFNNWNTLIYTGPVIDYNFGNHQSELATTINTSVLYVIPNTKNFIGLENNMDIDQEGFHDYLRPQIKVGILHNLMVGLVTGIPLSKHENSKGDIMTRIIWEP